MTRFEVDPRNPPAPRADGEQSPGLGPVLYKEWRLTSPAEGDGLLESVTGGDQTATLILHGRGLGCTEASHFTAWTLLISGTKGQATFYGALAGPSFDTAPAAP